MITWKNGLKSIRKPMVGPLGDTWFFNPERAFSIRGSEICKRSGTSLSCEIYLFGVVFFFVC